MLEIVIPGFGGLRLAQLVCDYNGTLAHDGRLLPGVRELLTALSADLVVHVVTADTHGGVSQELAGCPVTLHVLGPGNQAAQKRAYVEGLGVASTVAIGNGRNDHEMLSVATLGIAVTQGEGAFAGTLASADVIIPTIVDALELLTHPARLVATLRD